MSKYLNQILELESENRTLKALLKDKTQALSQYEQPLQTIELGEPLDSIAGFFCDIKLPDYCIKQAGDEIDNNNTEEEL